MTFLKVIAIFTFFFGPPILITWFLEKYGEKLFGANFYFNPLFVAMAIVAIEIAIIIQIITNLNLL